MFELKKLSPGSIPEALIKVERYRLLNEPREAESICRDILEIEPDNQQALIGLLLSLTDQIGPGSVSVADQARQLISRLKGEYERSYYTGIICERRGKAQLAAAGPRSGYNAYGWLSEAMGFYEKAEALRPEGNDEAILRWNTCARMVMKNPEVRPEPEDAAEIMLE